MHGRTRVRRRAAASAMLAAAMSAGLAPVAQAADVSSTWFGGNAFWDDAALWNNSPAVAEFPNKGNGGLTYDVLIASGTVDQAADYTIEALTLSGGSINGITFDLTVNQSFDWSSGTLSGSGDVLANAGFTLHPGGKMLNRTLNNAGFATWLGSSLFGSGTINNQAGAIFDIQTFMGAPVIGISQFNNAGTIMKLSPGDNSFGGVVTFNNTGTLDLAAGKLNINGNVNQVSGGTLTGGTWNVGGTLVMPLGGAITTIGSGATVRLFGGGGSFTNVDGLTTNQGTFGVANFQSFTTTGPFSNTGTLKVEADGTFTVNTSLAQQPADTLTAGTYIVGGTLVLPGANIITNQANVTLDGPASSFAKINTLANNQGTFTLLNGRTFTPAAAFNNAGTVNVGSTSTLTLGFNGTHTGSFALETGGVVTLSAGTHTFGGAAAFSGGGVLNINNSAVLDPSVSLTAPAITNFNGGTISGAGGGSLSVPAGSTFRFALSNAKTLSGVIDNAGLTQWMGSSGVFGSGTFNNLAGGSFQIITGSSTAFGISQFNNAGTITKSSGGGPATNFGGAMTFNNTGTVNLSAGTFNINGPLTQAPGTTLTGGTWNVSNTGALVLTSAFNLDTIGPAAAVSLSGASSTFSKIDTLADNQGAFTITNTRNFTTVSDLANSGTITVGPGSTLTVNGVFTNSGTVNGPGVVAASSFAMQSGTVDAELTGSVSLTKTTAATLTLNAANTYTGDTTVAAGTLVMTQGLKSGGALLVADGADAVVPAANPSTFDPGVTYPSGDNATGSLIGSLSLDGSAQLDLNNSDMIVDHDGDSPLSEIRALLASGYNFGGQDGPGIISTTALNTDPFTFALGYAENADLPIPYGTQIGLGTLFSGFDVDHTAVLIKFTWIGDVTLDGIFDFQDLSIFNGNYDAGATTGRLWGEGDLNYDGTIDFQDLSLFNGNYNPSKPSLPEPGSILLLFPALLGLLPVRRRRRGW